MDDFYNIRIKPLYQYFRKESAAFWFACMYLMFEYVRPQSIYTVIDVLPWAQLTIILLAGFALVDKKSKWVSNSINKVLILFFLVILVSAAVSYNPKLAFSKLNEFYIWLIVFFLLITVVNTEKRFFIFLLFFLLFNFKMSQHGFMSWAMRGFAFKDWGVTGSPGWFQNSGEFGIELCIYVPLSIYFILSLYKNWSRLKLAFFLAMPFTALASVVATSSRGALVGVFGAFMWMLIKSKHKTKGLIIVAIASVVLISIIPEESKTRFESAGEDKTSHHRMNIWKIGIKELNDHPLLGVGFGNWPNYYLTKYPDAEGSALVHNIFIQAGTELGYIGLLVLLLLILFSFINNYQTRKLALQIEDTFLLNMAHGFDAAMIGFLISASFVTVLYYPFLWINLVFVVILNNVTRKKYREIRLANKQSEETI